jgi:hypothetical protein
MQDEIMALRRQVAELSARLALIETRHPIGANGTNGHRHKVPEPVAASYDYVI